MNRCPYIPGGGHLLQLLPAVGEKSPLRLVDDQQDVDQGEIDDRGLQQPAGLRDGSPPRQQHSRVEVAQA